MTARKRLVCSFGGGGGGAAGFASARASLYGADATFELVGGFDKDAYACRAFEYLTGVDEVQTDARELTPGAMRELFGDEAPFAFFGSPPCQGASKLLSSKKSREAKYEALNELALVNVRLILDAWASSPPAFILLENVPNITTRAKGTLAGVRKLLKAAGYVLQDGFHECRHVGNLAQRRKRWFLVARNPAKVPAFLYHPPRRPGLVCGVAPTVAASAQVDNSAVALADPRPAPAFVALSYDEAKRVTDGEVVAPFAIVDPADPGEPLAIVDDMRRPPYRWAGEGKKRRKVAVPLVLVSADGTWHRPLTTLELAVLQGLPWRHRGRALDFGGGSTKQRELIGNMVPPPVGTAIAEQMLLAGLAADQGAFYLTNGGGGVWVSPDRVPALERLGVRRVRPADAQKVAGEFVLLDDRAPRVRARRRGPTFEAVMGALKGTGAAVAAERVGS